MLFPPAQHAKTIFRRMSYHEASNTSVVHCKARANFVTITHSARNLVAQANPSPDVPIRSESTFNSLVTRSPTTQSTKTRRRGERAEGRAESLEPTEEEPPRRGNYDKRWEIC
jgi:hypothetical protein